MLTHRCSLAAVVFSLVSAVILVFADGSARATSHCSSTILRCGFDTLVLTDPAGIITCDDGFFSGEARYDLAAGSFAAAIRAGDVSFASSILSSDKYVVTGLPEGTLLNFTAQMRARGFVGAGSRGGGEVGASLRSGDGTPASMNSRATVDTVLILPVQVLSGLPFELFFDLFCDVGDRDGTGLAQIEGQLSFAGLPPGSTITSCHGFVESLPVQTRTSSWGRIKVRYR